MPTTSVFGRFCLGVLAVTALVPVAASAGDDSGDQFHKIVVFGDSLSDPGNVFALTGQYSIQPFMPVPSAPYAVGGMHFTDGETWIESASRELGTSTAAGPALRVPGVFTNYAFGGARARPGAPTASPDLATQVAMYFSDSGGAADPEALYVIWLGSLDITDAVAALAADPSGASSIGVLQAAIGSISGSIQTLWGAGARVFLIPNAPDLAATPAVTALGPQARSAAEQFSSAFNAALAQLLNGLELQLPQVRIARVDVFSALNAVLASPDAYGLSNTTEPCLKFGTAVHAICSDPRTYLFWDAIHPTAAVHRILAGDAVEALTAQ